MAKWLLYVFLIVGFEVFAENQNLIEVTVENPPYTVIMQAGSGPRNPTVLAIDTVYRKTGKVMPSYPPHEAEKVALSLAKEIAHQRMKAKCSGNLSQEKFVRVGSCEGFEGGVSMVCKVKASASCVQKAAPGSTKPANQQNASEVK